MTFIYELSPYSLQLYHMCEYELLISGFSKVIVWQTYRKTWRQLCHSVLRVVTNTPEIISTITYLQSVVSCPDVASEWTREITVGSMTCYSCKWTSSHAQVPHLQCLKQLRHHRPSCTALKWRHHWRVINSGGFTVISQVGQRLRRIEKLSSACIIAIFIFSFWIDALLAISQLFIISTWLINKNTGNART